MKTNINKFKPAVSNQILVSLAGLLWILVGIMLVSHALTWYKEFTSTGLVYYIVAGVLFGLIIHHWGFLKIVNKNLIRIHLIETKYCLFGFMPWKSYILIAIMMTLLPLWRVSKTAPIISGHTALPKTGSQTSLPVQNCQWEFSSALRRL